MTFHASVGAYGVQTDKTTVTIERLLPGPIERVWAYLTDSDLRKQWLAAGVMDLRVGSTVDLVWRNDELTDPPGSRPDGFGEEHSMTSRIVELDAPRRLVLSWGVSSEVSFSLHEQGNGVLLTLIHRKLPARSDMLNVSAGWHVHLDILAARLAGERSTSFWDSWTSLKREYESRIAAW